MTQYQNTLDEMRAGTIFGPVLRAEAKVVPSGVTFEFGDPVFVDAANENQAFEPDSTDTSLHFLGVAILSHNADNKYVEYQDMSVLGKGEIYVHVASGIVNCANQPAYVGNLIGDAAYKKFTTSSSNAFDIGGYFRSNANADGIARVEVRGVK